MKVWIVIKGFDHGEQVIDSVHQLEDRAQSTVDSLMRQADAGIISYDYVDVEEWEVEY